MKKWLQPFTDILNKKHCLDVPKLEWVRMYIIMVYVIYYNGFKARMERYMSGYDILSTLVLNITPLPRRGGWGEVDASSYLRLQ